jgi:hypothetical protein
VVTDRLRDARWVAIAAQNNNYTATTYTPRGVYRTVIHAD